MSGGAGDGRAGGADPFAPGIRLAELRSARAERLARLRGARAPAAAEAEDPAALAVFLRALRAAIADKPLAAAGADAPPAAAGGPGPAPAAVLRFQRAPERAGDRPCGRARLDANPAGGGADRRPGDLDRLPGAGPGLVWALERAGVARLADLAASEPLPLADRLGPIGGLIDLPAWIAFARTAAPPG